MLAQSQEGISKELVNPDIVQKTLLTPDLNNEDNPWYNTNPVKHDTIIDIPVLSETNVVFTNGPRKARKKNHGNKTSTCGSEKTKQSKQTKKKREKRQKESEPFHTKAGTKRKTSTRKVSGERVSPNEKKPKTRTKRRSTSTNNLDTTKVALTPPPQDSHMTSSDDIISGEDILSSQH